MTATLTYTMILAAILFGRKAILYLENQETVEGARHTAHGDSQDNI